MATVVVMPQLGNTVESCIIDEWTVAVGDVIDENTNLCVIETDKATMEVPSGTAGTVLKLLGEPGDEVPVKQPIAVVGEPGEDAAAALAAAGFDTEATSDEAPAESASDEPAESKPAADTTPAPAVSTAAGAATGGSSPRARARAAETGASLDRLTGTGPKGRIIERDVLAAPATQPAATTEKPADHSDEQFGTGIGGRFTSRDRAAGKVSEAPKQAIAAEFPGEFTDTTLTGIRKIVAERMMHSLASSAQLTFDATAPAAGLLALRKRLKNSDPALGLNGVTIGDLVNFAAVKTVMKYPSMNAHLEGKQMRTFESVHLGFACDTPRGLLVPTIQFSDQLNLSAMSAQAKELANQAIEGSISPDLLAGATFTVTNLGNYGIESFTPLLNVPQTAILGVDAIVNRPVLNADGSVGIEQRIGFSLTVDHRVVDGADAARYLKDLAAAIENIDITVLG